MSEYIEELRELAEEESVTIPEWVGEDEAEKILAVYWQCENYLNGMEDEIEDAIWRVENDTVDFERLGGSPVGKYVATFEPGSVGFGKLQDRFGYRCHEFDVYDSGDVVGHLDITGDEDGPAQDDEDWLYCYVNASEREHWIVFAGTDE